MADTYTEAKDWNFNLAWLQRLNQNLIEADISARVGNMNTFFRSLIIIYNQMHWRLVQKGTKEEEDREKELKAKFIKAKQLFKAGAMGVRNANSQTEILLQDIAVLLNDLVFNYKFIELTIDKLDPDKAVSEGIRG